MPLVEYESEIFAECGAWKNYPDLEDSLTLDELIELYNITLERQGRLMKTVAAAFGADVSDSSSPTEYGPSEDDSVMYDQYDLQSLPFGVGYETIE